MYYGIFEQVRSELSRAGLKIVHAIEHGGGAAVKCTLQIFQITLNAPLVHFCGNFYAVCCYLEHAQFCLMLNFLHNA
jgi:hypothetical protein